MRYVLLIVMLLGSPAYALETRAETGPVLVGIPTHGKHNGRGLYYVGGSVDRIPIVGGRISFWCSWDSASGSDFVRVVGNVYRTETFIVIEWTAPFHLTEYYYIQAASAFGKSAPYPDAPTSTYVGDTYFLMGFVGDISLLPYSALEQNYNSDAPPEYEFEFKEAQAIEVQEIDYTVTQGTTNWDITIQQLPGVSSSLGPAQVYTIDSGWYLNSPAKTMIDSIMIGFATWQAFLLGLHETRRN